MTFGEKKKKGCVKRSACVVYSLSLIEYYIILKNSCFLSKNNISKLISRLQRSAVLTMAQQSDSQRACGALKLEASEIGQLFLLCPKLKNVEKKTFKLKELIKAKM